MLLTPFLANSYTQKVTRGGAEEARRAHNPKVVGSNLTHAARLMEELEEEGIKEEEEV